jgi:hypothetical protein
MGKKFVVAHLPRELFLPLVLVVFFLIFLILWFFLIFLIGSWGIVKDILLIAIEALAVFTLSVETLAVNALVPIMSRFFVKPGQRDSYVSSCC